MTNTTLCWVVSDGKIGIDNQCIGLAEAVGVTPILKHVTLRSPWRHMFPIIAHLHAHAFRPGDALAPPWPDLLITGGRSGAAVSLFVKKASGGKTVTVHIQNPHIDPKRFDLMVVGAHDKVTGENVFVIRGALNRVTAEKIADGVAHFAKLAALPQPRLAVLIGGANRCYKFEKADAQKLAAQLAALAKKGFSVMVTASRRTGTENEALLKAALDLPNCFFWDGAGENPYFALLGLADVILPTADSISMVSEAASTGKPVQVIPLTGGDSKFRAFHAMMEQGGITRPFTGKIESWTYRPLTDTAEAAALVKPLLEGKLV
jgi:mitochondrial fission protein ELM1